MSSFKSYTARLCIDKMKGKRMYQLLRKFRISNDVGETRKHHFWIEGFHPELIQGHDMMKQKVNYIHENPVRAGYVEKAEDWIYSSASNYINGRGLIDLKTEWFE